MQDDLTFKFFLKESRYVSYAICHAREAFLLKLFNRLCLADRVVLILSLKLAFTNNLSLWRRAHISNGIREAF